MINSEVTDRLIQQEVDFATAIFAMTKDRVESVAFMRSFWEESLGFVVKQPRDRYLTALVNSFNISEHHRGTKKETLPYFVHGRL